MIFYTPMINEAIKICFVVHKNQFDKGGMPYCLHPIHLAEHVGDDEDAIVTALLHDVVEDSNYTLKDLRNLGFSDTVCDAVGELTRINGEPYMRYIRRVKTNPLARRVKIADLKHNSDLSRLKIVTDVDRARREKYLAAIAFLEDENEG